MKYHSEVDLVGDGVEIVHRVPGVVVVVVPAPEAVLGISSPFLCSPGAL